MANNIYDKTLKEYYGYDKLKDLQKQIIIASVEKKKDVLAILATGYGKSVCYQLPFLILQKPIIIISPLLALMEDQKNSLEEKDIPVVCLNSNLSQSVKNYEKEQILKGNYKIIYMTPEYLQSSQDFLLDLYENHDLSLIAIDEAHCVSSWGNDFRPEYKKLSCIKDWMPNINIMALTATATEKVREDIKLSLKMTKVEEVISSFDRPNLYLSCQLKSGDIKHDLKDIMTKNKDIFTIIYVRTREMTDKIAKVIKTLGIDAKAYHAGLNSKDRIETQKEFQRGDIKCIVATIAFGMGIDQNINLVIHYGSPGDVESYYQEIGRAGRDLTPANCILFYEKDDMRINRFLLKDIKEEIYKKSREKQIKLMQNFLNTTLCRKKYILEYFGESYNKCNNCDNCIQIIEDNTKIKQDIQYPVYLFLKLISTTKTSMGIGKLITILSGKKDVKVKDYYSSSLYGLGKMYTVEFWKAIIEILLYNDYITEASIPSGFGSVIKSTSKSANWYKKILAMLVTAKIKSDTYEHILLILPEIELDLTIPKDCLKIKEELKIRNLSCIEELMTNSI